MPTTQDSPNLSQPINQPPVRKDRSITNWEKLIIISSGALLIIIIIILSYWFFELRPKIEKQTIIQTEEFPKEFENQNSEAPNLFTQNWELISNNVLGVELKQPPDWQLEINKKPKHFLFTENKNDWNLEKYQEIVLKSPNYTSSTVKNGGEEIKSGSRIIVIPFKNSLSFDSVGKVNPAKIGVRDFDKNIIIDDQKARRIDYTLDTAFYFTEVYILRNSKAFLISRSYLEGERSVFEEIFTNLLESFKFTLR